MTDRCPKCNRPTLKKFHNNDRYLCGNCKRRFTQEAVADGRV